MYNNEFLQKRLQFLLENYFSDIPSDAPITIVFGRQAARRFGSIRLLEDGQTSHIILNGCFKTGDIPLEIIDATIAHELCHYVHGFGSPLPKKYRHPHQGGVILKEMSLRGLKDLYAFEKKWTKLHWREHAPIRASRRKRVRRQSSKSLFIQVLKHLLKP